MTRVAQNAVCVHWQTGVLSRGWFASTANLVRKECVARHHRNVRRGCCLGMAIFPNSNIQAATDRIARIEKLCAQDVGRNIATLSNHTRGSMFSAAMSIASHPAPSLAFLTGFYIPGASPPACETDGPIGTALAARGLADAKIPVRVVTDCFSASGVQAALQVGLNDGEPSYDDDQCGISLMLGHENGESKVEDILKDWKREGQEECGGTGVTHVLSVERPGPSSDGNTYNMRGQDIGEWNSGLDRLFLDGAWKTIGIGDGGNELGMGSLPAGMIEENVQYGSQIACTVPCDHLIVCGVSNWGAWGLAAALAILRQDWHEDIMKYFEKEWFVACLNRCVEMGPAVDGVTGRQMLSVDGLDWRIHAKMMQDIREIASEPLLNISLGS